MIGLNSPTKHFLLAFSAVLLLCSVQLRGQAAQEIAKESFRSTVLLVMEDSHGQPISLGSGFFVRPGEIATNLHVVAGAVRGYAKLIGEEKRFEVQGFVAVDSLRDLIILKVKDDKAPSTKLGDSDSVEIGERVYAVGNPQGLEGTFSEGIISGIRTIEKNRLLQITAPISPGSSGGPVLSHSGEVIGVSVATFKEGQNLNFAVPASYLSALVAGKRPEKPIELSELVKDSDSPSIFEKIGGSEQKGAVGDRFTWDSPTQSGEFSFSIRNKLREPIHSLFCFVIFYDEDESPIDFVPVLYEGIIPAGLAKRVKSNVDKSTEQLNSPPLGGFHGADPSWYPPRKPIHRVEIRILDFSLGID